MQSEQTLGVRLRNILPLLSREGRTFLCHEFLDISVLAENLQELTSTGQKDFAALLDAWVAKIVPSDMGTEVILTGVEPEELMRFNLEYAKHQEAEHAMGLSM